MPRWRGGRSSVLVTAIFSLFITEGLGQTFNVVYYTDNLCTQDVLTKTNQVLGTCDDISYDHGSGTVLRGYKISCASSTAQHANYGATDLVVAVDQAGCGISNEGALIYRGMPLSNVCWHIQGDRSLYLKWTYPAAASSLCGESLPVSPSPSVVGDPVTWHGNIREEFRLPPGGVLAPLLLSSDMHVLASSRPGHEDDEWIDRVVITSGVGEGVLDVSIKRNLTHFNRAALPSNSFETLDVRMEWWREGLLSIMPPGDAQFNHWSGITLAFGRVRHFGQLKAGAAPRREAVYIVSNSLKILILSSAAREYFPERDDLGVEYSHLDLEIMEISDERVLRGILPELWGFIPMSEETRKLRKVPKPSEELNDGPRTLLPEISDSRSKALDINASNSTEAENCTATGSAMPREPIRGEAAAVASVEGLSRERRKDSAGLELPSVVAAL